MDLLRDFAREHPSLYLLLDDSGCCGPGNVFLQADPPRATYVLIGWAGEVPVYANPTFLRGAGASELSLDVRAAPLDDSFSLETQRGARFTVTFDGVGPAAAETS